MKSVAARVIFLMGLSGCAMREEPNFRWVHDMGASQAQFERDGGDCGAQALNSHPWLSTERGMEIFFLCMRGRGWRAVSR